MNDEKINCVDLYELDREWPEEYQTLVSQVRRFVDSEVLPTMAEAHENASFPKQIISGVKKLALLEAHADDQLDPLAYGLALRELERGSSGLRTVSVRLTGYVDNQNVCP